MLKILYPNGLKKAFTLSYDDGCYDDIRLLDLMSSLKIKGTFNVSSGLFRPEGQQPFGSWERMTLSERKNYSREGIEVAIHGAYHLDFTKLTAPELYNEIVSDKAALEKEFGGVIRGGAYPYGSFNDESVSALKRLGIKYCRTVWSDDSMKLPADWLRLRPTAHHNDPKLPGLVDRFIGETPDEVSMLYIWGHTPEFSRDRNWGLIEDILAKVSGRGDVWFAENIEICEYALAARSLEYSADGRSVYNPTAKEIWLESGDSAASVKPGETKSVR